MPSSVLLRNATGFVRRRLLRKCLVFKQRKSSVNMLCVLVEYRSFHSFPIPDMLLRLSPLIFRRDTFEGILLMPFSQNTFRTTYSVVTPRILPKTSGTAQSCHQGASGDTA